MPRHSSPYRDGLTKADKLLAILRDRAAHSTKELVRRVGHTFGGAVFKLRRQGRVIERISHPAKAHEHQYQLRDDQPR